MRKLIALLALSFLFVAGACGDDSDGDDAASATTVGDTVTTLASSSGGGGNFASYCGARAGLTAPNPSSFGSGDMKTTMEAALRSMEQAADVPSEIKDDVKIVVDAARPFYKFLADNNYDYMAIGTNPAKRAELEALSNKFEEEKVKAAGERIENWAKQHCS